MTSRRSMQSPDARISRAFQFVPGHVSGRVASAQPVRTRTHVGSASRPIVLGTPPTSVSLWSTRVLDSASYAGTTATVPTPSIGETMVAVLQTRCGSGMDITVPVGWRTMAEGAVGSHSGTMKWVLAIIDVVDGSEPLGFDISAGSSGGDPLMYNSSWRAFTFRYAGGVGGTWSHALGYSYDGVISVVGQYKACAVDPAWQVWMQACMVGGWYTNVSNPPGAYYGAASWLGSINSVPDNGYPGVIQPTVWADDITYEYGTFGAFGDPQSQSIAFGWTP